MRLIYDMILGLLDRVFKRSIINTLSVLIKKVDNMEEQMGNVSRKMKTLQKN